MAIAFVEFFPLGVLMCLFFPFVMRANRSLTATLRKEGQVELLGETPKRLGAGPILQPRPDGCQYYSLAETEKSLNRRLRGFRRYGRIADSSSTKAVNGEAEQRQDRQGDCQRGHDQQWRNLGPERPDQGSLETGTGTDLDP
jgi:hypothetical protein